MVLRKFQILAFCFGLIILLGGMYVGYQSKGGFGLMVAGVFLMGGAGALYIAESKDDKEILRLQKEKVNIIRPSYGKCKEARERVALGSKKARKILLEDELQKDAQENLGWGQTVILEDWWQGIYIECSRCRNTFKLLPEDRERLKFPSQPDPTRGIYLEVICKDEKCSRRITVFRS